MPRYFFNVLGSVDMFDTEGAELGSLREVRLFMLGAAMKVMQRDENQSDTWQMEAIDERGRIVSTMDFGVAEDEED